MGWSRPDEECRADYERDLHKHDFEPLKPTPHSTAMDIAMFVQRMSLVDGGKLIQQWAGWQADAERGDAVRAGAGR